MQNDNGLKSPKIELHSEALKSFSKRASDLFESVTTIVESNKERFSPDRFPVISIKPDQVNGSPRREIVDTNSWKVTQIAFPMESGIVGLDETATSELENLSDSIQRVAQLKNLVSQKFIKTVLLDWIEEKLQNQNTIQFGDFLVEKITISVRHLNLWVPIANFYLEAPIKLGNVSLRTINSELMDRWLSDLLQEAPEDGKEEIIENFQKTRSQLQGLAAACRSVVAEPDYAKTKCLQEAESAVDLLRCLHPANMFPRSCLYTRPLGSEGLESYQALFVEEDRILIWAQDIRDPLPVSIKFEKEKIAALQVEISFIDKLLGESNRSEYQEKLLNALLLYSKANITKDISEKLVFIFSALESMLLRNETEPIQQNIADRIAFILGKTVEERRNIVALTKECYGFRSRYIHHGYRRSDEEVLQEFMLYVWVLFMKDLLYFQKDYSTKNDMLEYVDNLKYSGENNPNYS